MGALTLLVRDLDEAIAFYTKAIGMTLLADSDLGGGRRWVEVGSAGGGARLVLSKAKNDAEIARIGDQTGGRVFLFIETDDFDRDHARMLRAGVHFREAPRHEAYGTVAVFEDLYGNAFDLIERRNPG